MAKTAGHYSGWVKRETVKPGRAGPIGVFTRPKGHRIAQFAPPKTIDADKLEAALDTLFRKRRDTGA